MNNHILSIQLQLNAGLSTQLLLTLFDVKGVVHFGIAGNANSDLQIGDVAIPRRWAHTGLWNWQVIYRTRNQYIKKILLSRQSQG